MYMLPHIRKSNPQNWSQLNFPQIKNAMRQSRLFNITVIITTAIIRIDHMTCLVNSIEDIQNCCNMRYCSLQIRHTNFNIYSQKIFLENSLYLYFSNLHVKWSNDCHSRALYCLCYFSRNKTSKSVMKSKDDHLTLCTR